MASPVTCTGNRWRCHVDWSQQQSNCITADQREGYCDIADVHCCLIDSICMDDSVYQGSDLQSIRSAGMMPSDDFECCCQRESQLHQGEKCKADHIESKNDHSRSKRACVGNTGSILCSLTCVPQVSLAVLIWQQSCQAGRSYQRLQQCFRRGSSCPLQSAAGQYD